MISGLLVPFRTDSIVAANVALVFVIVVVIAAAEGGRTAGIVAAVVSTLCYDFFFTRPFQSLKIDNGDDIGTAVLLLGDQPDRRPARRLRAPEPQAERPQLRRHRPSASRRGAGSRRRADRRDHQRGRIRDHGAALVARVPVRGGPVGGAPRDRAPRRTGRREPALRRERPHACPTRARSSGCSAAAASSDASCSLPASRRRRLDRRGADRGRDRRSARRRARRRRAEHGADGLEEPGEAEPGRGREDPDRHAAERVDQ